MCLRSSSCTCIRFCERARFRLAQNFRVSVLQLFGSLSHLRLKCFGELANGLLGLFTQLRHLQVCLHPSNQFARADGPEPHLYASSFFIFTLPRTSFVQVS